MNAGYSLTGSPSLNWASTLVPIPQGAVWKEEGQKWANRHSRPTSPQLPGGPPHPVAASQPSWPWSVTQLCLITYTNSRCQEKGRVTFHQHVPIYLLLCSSFGPRVLVLAADPALYAAFPL